MRFFSELKRRKVYNVAAMYAAAAFVLWQAADIIVPSLDLPSWTMKAVIVLTVIGFPIALVLAWVYDITPTAPASESETTAIDDATSVFGWRRFAIGALAVLLFISGGWWAVNNHVRPKPRSLSEASLAVFPFHVNGNDALAYMREGLLDLLSRNLSNATDLQPLDPSLMLKIAKGADTLGAASAGNIARNAGAMHFITGSVSVFGGQLQIDASLYQVDADSARLVATKTEKGDSTRIFDMVDSLTTAFLAELGGGAASERVAHTAANTTRSIPALKAYLLGEHSYRVGDSDNAIEQFTKALELDSSFVVARYRLAIAHHMARNYVAAAEDIAAAARDSMRLPPHDRALIHAFHDLHAGHVSDAETQLRKIVGDFPRDLESKVMLGQVLTTYGMYNAASPAEARELFEQVQEADPKFTCITCQMTRLAELDHDIPAVRHLARVLRASDGVDSTRLSAMDSAFIAVMFGDTATVIDLLPSIGSAADKEHRKEARVSVLTRTVLSNAMLHGEFSIVDRVLADPDILSSNAVDTADIRMRLRLARGNWANADRDIGAVLLRPNPPSMFLQHYSHITALPFDMKVDLQGYRARLATWTGFAVNAGPGFEQRLQPMLRMAMQGLAASRTGDMVEAQYKADSLTVIAARNPTESNAIKDLAAFVRADVALRTGKPNDAVSVLNDVSMDVSPNLLNVYSPAFDYMPVLRAKAYQMAGDYSRALNWLRYGVPRDGNAITPLQYALYERDMGDVLDHLGHTAEAKPHYAAFINTWKDADPALQPQVEAARKRLASLVEGEK